MYIPRFVKIPLHDRKGQVQDRAFVFEQNPPPDIVIFAGNFWALNKITMAYEAAVICQGYTEAQAIQVGHVPAGASSEGRAG